MLHCTMAVKAQCRALSASGQRCTRRVNESSDSGLCGTHMRGTPHGTTEDAHEAAPSPSRIEVRVQDICGINYYVDDAHNVYNPGDVVGRKQQPRIVGQWERNAAGAYSIPALGLGPDPLTE